MAHGWTLGMDEAWSAQDLPRDPPPASRPHLRPPSAGLRKPYLIFSLLLPWSMCGGREGGREGEAEGWGRVDGQPYLKLSSGFLRLILDVRVWHKRCHGLQEAILAFNIYQILVILQLVYFNKGKTSVPSLDYASVEYKLIYTFGGRGIT